MRSTCRRQAVVSSVAIVAWVAVLVLLAEPPGPADAMRLPFFALLMVAGGASTLAVLPWMLSGYLGERLLYYVAGLMHGEVDKAEESRPELTVVR